MNKKNVSLGFKILLRTAGCSFFTFVIFSALYFGSIYDYFFPAKKVLTVYAFRNVISEDIWDEFSEQTGIPVNVNYFGSNEELFANFRVSGGEGYDLVVPSDYMVESLIRNGWLQEIDKSKISNFDQIDPRFLGKFFDVSNKYSLPWGWTLYGIGFSREVFKDSEIDSWKPIFNKNGIISKKGFKFSMVGDSKEAFFLGGFYLFSNINKLNDEKIDSIKNLLISQKDMVECYTNEGIRYLLLSNVIPAAVTPGAAVMNVIKRGTRFGFVVPKEGTLVDILNLAVPARSKNVKEVHHLIDFLLSRQTGILNFRDYGYFPTNKGAANVVWKRMENRFAFIPDDILEKSIFINNNVSLSKLENTWYSVKS